MVFLLLIIILILIITIAHLCFDFYFQKKSFKCRVDVLEEIILKQNEKKLVQLNQLELSNALSNQLKAKNSELNKTIYETNHEILSLLFNKNED